MNEQDELLLTPEEQDKCVASEKQLEAYLAEPDDKTAESLTMPEKRLIAKCILYGNNIMKAQLAKVKQHYEQKRLDRPELREKIRKLQLLQFQVIRAHVEGKIMDEENVCYVNYITDRLLALIPDIEEVKKQLLRDIEKYNGSYIDKRFWKSKFWQVLKENKKEENNGDKKGKG